MKHKAIFLDRDGIINMERGEYTWKPKDFTFVDGLIPALQLFVKNAYRLVVVSNQSGIGKGVYTYSDVEKLHSRILDTMHANGIEIDEIYYCPHHPDTGRCICRKPDSLLIEKALARFEIDPERSFFIGDRERDILAAEKVQVKGILVPSNTPLTGVAGQIISNVHSN
ncbi:MAG: D-glycero-alpha-D-manno-heptose-1,7-bisphosphate 7-phosphatase [Bacteroidia bacterium]